MSDKKNYRVVQSGRFGLSLKQIRERRKKVIQELEEEGIIEKEKVVKK